MSTVGELAQQLNQAVLLGEAAPYGDAEQKILQLSPQAAIEALGSAAELLTALCAQAGDASVLASDIQSHAISAANRAGAIQAELAPPYEHMGRQGRQARLAIEQFRQKLDLQKLATQGIISRLGAAAGHLTEAVESIEDARNLTASARAATTNYITTSLQATAQSLTPERKSTLFLLSPSAKRVRGVNRHALGVQAAISTSPFPVGLNTKSRLADTPLELVSRPASPMGAPHLVPHPGKLAVASSGGPLDGMKSRTLIHAQTKHCSYEAPRATGVIDTAGRREQRHPDPEVSIEALLGKRSASNLPDQLDIDSYELPAPLSSLKQRELLTDVVEVLLRGYVADAALRLTEYLPNSHEVRFTAEAQARGLPAATLHESQLSKLFLGHTLYGLNRIVISDTYTRGTREPAVAAAVDALRRLGCVPIERGVQATRIAGAPVIEIRFTNHAPAVLPPSSRTVKELPG